MKKAPSPADLRARWGPVVDCIADLLGPNAEFVDVNELNSCLQEMVKMSSLQNNSFELIESTHEVAIIGAAVAAGQARQ